MDKVARLLERVILGSRWLLAIFFGGLAVGLAAYAASFVIKLFKIVTQFAVLDEDNMILSMLGLIDAALVASLIVMVMISSYENFVSRFTDTEATAVLSWMGKLDASSLKIKVASSIVAISSIHLLQVFLNADHYTSDKILWATVLHMTFVISALLMAWLDRISGHHDPSEDPVAAPPDH